VKFTFIIQKHAESYLKTDYVCVDNVSYALSWEIEVREISCKLKLILCMALLWYYCLEFRFFYETYKRIFVNP
jgi:hypothetical protein